MALKSIQRAIALGVASVALVGSSAWAQDLPNLVFIMADDQGIEAMEGGEWSNELDVHMPNMAQLSEQGRVFTNVRVNPYCSPTRATMLTGRYALQTGLVHVVNEETPLPDRDLLSLQTHERTIGEVLQDMGYYTVLIDKYHLGWDESQGLWATNQGFDEYYHWTDFGPDDPEELGDFHTSQMVDHAIDAVSNRPENDSPYALFFWSIDAHSRPPDSGGLLWWEVSQNLAPLTLGEPGIDTNTRRYRAVLEALDTELGRMLETLGVTHNGGQYNPASETVVIYTTDNGTPAEVTSTNNRAKGTLYEYGIRVPTFVLGHNVPADGETDERLIGGVDFYETIADIVGAPAEVRGDENFPRDAMSFADSIGYAPENSLPRRTHSLSSLAPGDPWPQRVALTDGQFKIIVDAGYTGLADMSFDEVYDLLNDPAEEHNLVAEGMTVPEMNRYFELRDALVDYWGTSVSEAFQPGEFSLTVIHEDEFYRLIVQVDQGELLGPEHDEFYDLIEDPNATDNLVISGMDSDQEIAYQEMRDAVTTDLMSGEAGPDVSVVDLMLTHSLVLSSDRYVFSGPLRVGHDDFGDANHEELRAYLRFDIEAIDDLLPEGFTITDVVAAQVVVGFLRDSTSGDETATGVIRAYPITVTWMNNPRSYPQLEFGWEDTVLGEFQPAPHVIPDPQGDRLQGLPMPSGTPVSFGHNDNLLGQVQEWYLNPSSNNGLMLMVDPVEGLTGDQRVDFLRTAGIRLTLRRD